MALETAAYWSNIATAAFAILVALAGLLWWFGVRRRRSKRVLEDIDRLLEHVEDLHKVRLKLSAMLRDEETSEAAKTSGLLMMIESRLERMQFLLFMHFINSHFRPHEIPDMVKKWSLRSPLQWPIEKRGSKQEDR